MVRKLQAACLFCSVLLLSVSCANPKSAKQMSFRGMGYDRPALFVYSVRMVDLEKGIERFDTLGLFCSNTRSRSVGNQMLMQWQILRKADSFYQLVPERYIRYYTGISVDDTALFIHPPREIFRVLQFAPYPYIENNRSFGDSWEWDFEIGSVWSEPRFFPVDSLETFHISYTLVNDTVVESNFGLEKCYQIRATSKSSFGVSKANYFLHPEHGLLHCKIHVLDKLVFEFDLIYKTTGLEGILINKDFSDNIKAFSSFQYWRGNNSKIVR